MTTLPVQNESAAASAADPPVVAPLRDPMLAIAESSIVSIEAQAADGRVFARAWAHEGGRWLCGQLPYAGIDARVVPRLTDAIVVLQSWGAERVVATARFEIVPRGQRSPAS